MSTYDAQLGDETIDDVDINKSPEEEHDEEELSFEEPKPKAIIFWAIMAVCFVLILVCVGFAVVCGLNIIPNLLEDVTPGLEELKFKVPIEAILSGLIGGFLALFAIAFLTLRVLNSPCGVKEPRGARMYQISTFIADGARAFLTREFQILAFFVAGVSILLFFVDQSWYKLPTPVCFLVGAITSAVTSIIGMSIATAANVRTANAARQGMNQALRVAFNAGTVMGLSVVGLGLVSLCICYLLFRNLAALAGLGFGASSIALFARVGGGIFTKAADVGADLVGKVESNIPEDDPRNPAVIADNVGDNVGDVAGMGADLFESYVGSIIAAATLGAEFFGSVGVACPIYLSAAGILCSIIGSAMVSTRNETKEGEDVQGRLLWAIRRGIFSAAFLSIIAGGIIIFLLFDPLTQAWQLFTCYIVGLVSGVAIGLATEYCTSFSYRPTQSISEAGITGTAPVVIKGLSIGMVSTVAPVMIIVAAIVISVILGDWAGYPKPGAGIYGISVAAVGMLSTLGVTLATDAYGPVADNAGGIAEMSELPPQVRERTDALDALGNTTAATGKGFAIGSAVLTALALMSAFTRAGGISSINILEYQVISGLLIGSCLPFIFAALTMTAVGDAAMAVIVEVRRQFHTIPGLLEGKKGVYADHKACVDISTKSALQMMILPGILAVVAPIIVGIAGRQKMLGGMLAGSIASGFLLAVTMANAGGAWDNAKKFIEAGGLKNQETGEVYKKGSEAHKAAVVGDTVGDPFKDTSGPALNILIKLMTVISVVIAPLLKNFFPNS